MKIQTETLPRNVTVSKSLLLTMNASVAGLQKCCYHHARFCAATASGGADAMFADTSRALAAEDAQSLRL